MQARVSAGLVSEENAQVFRASSHYAKLVSVLRIPKVVIPVNGNKAELGVMLLSWWLLATIYFFPVWIVSYFTDRDLSFRASWKLAGAALLPGALLMSLGLALYGLGAFDLVQLAFAFTMHFIIGWIYLLISPMFLNRALPDEKKNPFGGKS